MSFNKLKFPARFGNKKQRALNNEVAKSEMAMAIKLTQLELREKKTIKPYIQETTDDQKFPTHITKRAMYITVDMTESDKQIKIAFLEKQGIISSYSDNGEISFAKKVE